MKKGIKDLIGSIRKHPGEQERAEFPIFSFKGKFEHHHVFGTYSIQKPASIGGPLDMKISLFESTLQRSPQGVNDLLEQFSLRVDLVDHYPFFRFIEAE